MAADAGVQAPAARSTVTAQAGALLALVDETCRELRAGGFSAPAATLESTLDGDLGFDSLGRMELLLRMERRFGVTLPQDTLQRAETVADLLHALLRGQAAAGPPSSALARTPLAAMETGAGETPEAAATLPDVLAWHVQAHPAQVQIVLLDDGGVARLSYRDLADAAGAVAAGLQRLKIAPRQTVAIMLPTCREYFSTYFGILLAGAVPVPIYPPARPSQLEDHVLRHAGILENAQAALLVVQPEAMLVARLLQARVPGLRHVVEPSRLAAGGAAPAPVPVQADDVAFIQYTSGSTGSPKGVALTHANLLANIRAMAHAVQATHRDVFVSWLPLYHDMGLIGAWLGSLYVGCPLVVMSPLAFLARPRRWLEAIHQWRGTLSAAPNFAYELCLKRIDDAALAGLDLSSWRLAFNGAEAVSPQTVRRFAQRFAPCGLRAEAVAPVYGLAEATVGLLFPPLGRIAPVDSVQREPFTREHRAVPAAPDDPQALRFVGCGRPLPGHAVRVVDDGGHELGERHEGRLEFRGPSATTRGYWRDPQRTAALYRDGWLDSGDRAYIAEGEVYVTGRVKDIVIRGGRNLYPEAIEEAVGSVPGVRKGCVAAFGSPDPATGTERLVVLAETRSHGRGSDAALREEVARAVLQAIGEPADDIVLAAPHTVLKTSSGKVRRSACRALYEAGTAGAPAAGVRRQLWRLAVGAIGGRARGVAAAVWHALFGAWAMLLFWLLAPAAWLATLAMPSVAAAWRLDGAAARTLLRLAGIPMRVAGRERLPAGPCVLVSNHASYLDGMVLVAALPRPFSFVAKRELLAQRVSGPFLRRLGATFVERFDVRRALEDAGQMAQAVGGGRSLAIFPEGTFVREPGLRPFHLGAFLAAARAQVPVVPVAIVGPRQILPDGSWRPRPGAIEVTVCEPLRAQPGADLFAAGVQLRDAASRAIAAHAAGC